MLHGPMSLLLLVQSAVIKQSFLLNNNMTQKNLLIILMSSITKVAKYGCEIFTRHILKLRSKLISLVFDLRKMTRLS